MQRAPQENPASPVLDARQPPAPWEHLESATLLDCGIFEVERHRCRHPRRDTEGAFTVLHTPHWVQAVTLTPEDELVLVNQYRFGSQTLSWEIPGGIVNPGESPTDAAVRELREETGYVAQQTSILGVCRPNPAFLDNHCSFVLLEQAEQSAATAWDEHEEIEIRTLPLDAVGTAVDRGEICHAITLAALFALQRHRGKT